jgi:uridylate kinase
MKKAILLKLSGELLSIENSDLKFKNSVEDVVIQIKSLQKNYNIGIVLGGGNFFRGASCASKMSISAAAAHEVGMISTVANGILFKEILANQGIVSQVLSPTETAASVKLITQDRINKSFENGSCVVFVGGTGNPFFTTDTSAVIRALQINSSYVLKGTGVDGVYNKDPKKHKDPKLLKQISFSDAISQRLEIVDQTALTLAEQNKVEIWIFNIFKSGSIVKSLENDDYASKIR